MLKAATTLQSAYERTDAALNLAAQRLETEYGQNFDPRLNPARLLRRIQALEEELPRLHEAAAANATAERELSHELHTQLGANHKATMGLAARAAVECGPAHRTTDALMAERFALQPVLEAERAAREGWLVRLVRQVDGVLGV